MWRRLIEPNASKSGIFRFMLAREFCSRSSVGMVWRLVPRRFRCADGALLSTPSSGRVSASCSSSEAKHSNLQTKLAISLLMRRRGQVPALWSITQISKGVTAHWVAHDRCQPKMISFSMTALWRGDGREFRVGVSQYKRLIPQSPSDKQHAQLTEEVHVRH